MLMINAALKTTEAKHYWAIPDWLPDKIGVIVDNGKLFCFEGEDLRLHLQRGMHVITVYELVGVVADICSGEHQKSHLVSLINGTYHSGARIQRAYFLQSLSRIVILPRMTTGISSMTFLLGSLLRRKLYNSHLLGRYQPFLHTKY